MFAGSYVVEFSVTTQHTNSQTWELITYTGDASLNVAPGGHASLQAGFDSESIMGYWHGSNDRSTRETGHRSCRWEGKAEWEARGCSCPCDLPAAMTPCALRAAPPRRTGRRWISSWSASAPARRFPGYRPGHP